jgi:type IV pilus assembly protein PilQ
MGSTVRLLAFSLCGALGIGVAVCVATSGSLVPEAPQPSAVAATKTTAAKTATATVEKSPTLSQPTKRKHVADVALPTPQAPTPSADDWAAALSPQPSIVVPRAPFAQQPLPSANSDLVNRLEGAINQLQQDRVSNQQNIDTAADLLEGLTGDSIKPSNPSSKPSPKPAPGPATAANAARTQAQDNPFGDDLPAPSNAATPEPVRPKIQQIEGEGDGRLSIHIQDSDLREVLDMIGEQGNLNILAAAGVQGRVSASLANVDIDTALAAILKSSGYIARREGNFIFVGTSKDLQLMEESVDKIGARIYRPNYIKAQELQLLIQPLLTPQVGIASTSSPAEVGIAADDANVGGDNFAGGEAVLVRDYEAVLAQVDQVFEELDKKPLQVAIEAMILSVKLNDKNAFGVDFALLRDKANVRLASGQPLSSLANMEFDGGLKFGFLDSSLAVFLNALETIGDANVLATPRLMCMNKQRAQFIIGQQLGYVNTTLTETSTAQNVQFLEVGTQLRLRPFISSDGMIRMEVHPELSTGTVRVEEGFTLPDKDVTQVTTNIMVPDGSTVIIGGLLREDLNTTTSQIPLLGSAPGIGFLFRQKTESIVRLETIVLITPHIIHEPKAAMEGHVAAGEFHRRQSVYADHMSPIGTRYLGRKYFRVAQDWWARGDARRAEKAVDLAINFDPTNRAAIDLRSDILSGNHMGDHSGGNGIMSQNLPGPVMPHHPGTVLPLSNTGDTGPSRSIVRPNTMQ